MLGLKNKGHLAPGAEGDVTIYTPDADIQKMFEMPRYVIRGGEVIVEEGEIRRLHEGKLLHVAPTYDEGAVADIQKWFEKYYTIQFRNYPVDEHYLQNHEVIASDN
jgi:formylmethanofuran dehydrogenase subunit A